MKFIDKRYSEPDDPRFFDNPELTFADLAEVHDAAEVMAQATGGQNLIVQQLREWCTDPDSRPDQLVLQDESARQVHLRVREIATGEVRTRLGGYAVLSEDIILAAKHLHENDDISVATRDRVGGLALEAAARYDAQVSYTEKHARTTRGRNRAGWFGGALAWAYVQGRHL